MCPLRFILVFFSAVLAAYFAWKTVRSADESDPAASGNSSEEKRSASEKQEFRFCEKMRNGFWVLVDMASGRYLWRNMKQLKSRDEVKSSQD